MTELIRLCICCLASTFRSRASLQAENLALRHQLCVYQRSIKRPKVKPADRILWSLLARAWTGWKDALIFVKVDKYRVRVRKPPSPTWRAFLKNHVKDIVSIDFLVVPTVRFRILYVFLFLAVERRRIIHFAVTEHPSAAWAAQHVVEAFPWGTAPKYLRRDRDTIYGDWFRQRVKNMGIEEALTAPQSPWQNPYSERLNGSVRRECLDHMIVLNEAHLKRILAG